jgi:hypothetical protein
MIQPRNVPFDPFVYVVFRYGAVRGQEYRFGQSYWNEPQPAHESAGRLRASGMRATVGLVRRSTVLG